MKHLFYSISISSLLVACNSGDIGQSHLEKKIACAEYIEGKYENEITEDYLKRYEFFYSPALDTCIADRFETLYQYGDEGYFTKMTLIDVVNDNSLISFIDTLETSNIFYITMGEFQEYKDILKNGTTEELNKYREKLSKVDYE